jgi:hypothetical protein
MCVDDEPKLNTAITDYVQVQIGKHTDHTK